jgi:hypothetical protein
MRGRYLVYDHLRDLGFSPRAAWAIRCTIYRFMDALDRIDRYSVRIEYGLVTAAFKLQGRGDPITFAIGPAPRFVKGL